MELSQKVVATHWYRFLNVLIKEGRYQWKTSDKDGNPRIISTLFLDGDLHCDIVTPDDQISENLSMEVASLHIEKMTADIGALNKFAEQITRFLALTVVCLSWLKFYENYISGIAFTVFFSAAIYLLRKRLFRWMMYMAIIFLKIKLPLLK